jgi:hypothetical protein
MSASGLGCVITKGKRTKFMPVSPDDLRTLIEMGLIEMRDEVDLVNLPVSFLSVSSRILVPSEGTSEGKQNSLHVA